MGKRPRLQNIPRWRGTTHFLTKTPAHVGTEMSLQGLAYNLKRVMRILEIARTMKAMLLVGREPFSCSPADEQNLSSAHSVTLKISVCGMAREASQTIGNTRIRHTAVLNAFPHSLGRNLTSTIAAR